MHLAAGWDMGITACSVVASVCRYVAYSRHVQDLSTVLMQLRKLALARAKARRPDGWGYSKSRNGEMRNEKLEMRKWKWSSLDKQVFKLELR